MSVPKKLIISLCVTMPGMGSLYADDAPNILIYLADDLGFASVNAYGAPEKFVKTPNINRLAEDGVRFTNAHTTASVCTPTRYSMLTGRYTWRTRLKKGVVNNNDPLLISTGRVTLGKWLQQRGYRTAHVGKWHLGYTEKKFKNLLGTIRPGPLDVGFDYHWGVPNNFDDLHKIYIENDHIYGLRSDTIESYGTSFYGKPYVGYDAPQRVCEKVMEETTTKAVDWIKKQPKDKPFFMYYAAVAVHHPIIPSEKMRGTSGAGLYGDFIHDIDHSLGRFIRALKDKGVYENTVVMFSSDNGGDIPADKTHPEAVAFDRGFTFNGENRGDKHTIYEGGLRVPFIVSCPGRFKKGARSHAFISTLDIFSTVAEIVSGTVPDPAAAAPDSFSFHHLLKDPGAKTQRPFIVHRDAPGRQALRRGKWKYIDNLFPENAKNKKPRTRGNKKLYDLENDPLERDNLFRKKPAVAREMMDLLERIRRHPRSREMAGD